AGLRQELMPQADTERWPVDVKYFAQCVDGIIHSGGVTRAVGNEVAVRFPRLHFAEGRARRKDFYPAAAFHEVGQDTPFYSQIERRNADRSVFVTYDVRLLCAHDGRQF